MFVCTGTGEELGDPQEVCRDVVGGGGETRTGVTGPGQGRSADFCFYYFNYMETLPFPMMLKDS